MRKPQVVRRNSTLTGSNLRISAAVKRLLLSGLRWRCLVIIGLLSTLTDRAGLIQPGTNPLLTAPVSAGIELVIVKVATV